MTYLNKFKGMHRDTLFRMSVMSLLVGDFCIIHGQPASPPLAVEGLTLESSFQEGRINPESVIHWSTNPGSIDNSGQVEIGFRVFTSGGFSLYKDKIKFSVPTGYFLTGVDYPYVSEIIDPITGKKVKVIKEGDVLVRIQKDKSLSVPKVLELSVEFVGCTQKVCLFPHTKKFTVPVYPATTANTDLPAKTVAPQPSSSPKPTVVTAPGSFFVGTLKELNEAIQKAKQSKKNILIDHWAEWCEACLKMDTLTFTDPLVKAELSKNWQLIKYNHTSVDTESDTVQKTFNVAALPTLTFIRFNSKGVEVRKNITTFLDAKELIKELKSQK